MLQQLMGKVPQGLAAAALTAPSSTGEGTLVLIFLIFHWYGFGLGGVFFWFFFSSP